MRILLITVTALLVIAALVLVIGAMLPRQHRATREITLNRSPREIYAVARDFGSAPSWRRNLLQVEWPDAVNGLVRFREVSKDGSVTYEIVEDTPGEKLVTRIVDRDLGYSGSWTYEFSPAENGTRVRITEDGEVSNILFRFVSRFVFGHTSTLDEYLLALGAKFGENVTPK
jgi:Polyketide cyclase / dehydrase and lipid transport